MSSIATRDTLHKGSPDCGIMNSCFVEATMKALQRKAEGISGRVTETERAATSKPRNFNADNTVSANAEDLTVSSASEGCLGKFDRRNPMDASFEATSGAVLVFAREAEAIHRDTVILIILVKESRHFQ